MFTLFPDKEVKVEKIAIPTADGQIPALVLSPKNKKVENATGVLWIHGGGYIIGMKEMVHMSRAVDLVKKFGCVVISPGYRIALTAPYPAAVNDCYSALCYLKENSADLNINPNQIMVGGESAGGGLCAAVCMIARDKGDVNVAYHMPLYPMLNNFETESSKDNHAHVWNTKINRFAWKMYLRGSAKENVSPYASPSSQSDYTGLPPAYTYIGDGDPFYSETVTYVESLKRAGVAVQFDVYHSNVHALDMMMPEKELSQKIADRFNEVFATAQKTYFAPQNK